MTFHRFAVPSYTGGLPGGYDYINNATSGTPAVYDGPRADGGPNNGTYFVGFGEDGRGRHVNRGLKALAENTDHLDDLLRRDLAIPVIRPDDTTVAPVASVILTGPGIFLGASGTPNTAAGINTFIEILDSEDKEIIDANGNRCMAVSLTGGTVGVGAFSAGNVTLTVNPPIPTGVTFRVYYGIHGNLATLPVDALTSIKIRSAQEVSALLEGDGGANLIGYAGGPAWADGLTNPRTTVELQLDKIVSDLSSTTLANSGTYHIGAVSIPGTYVSLIGGTLFSQLSTIATYLNRQYTTRTILGDDALQLSDSVVVLDTATNGVPYNLFLPDPALCTGQKFFLAAKDGLDIVTNYVLLLPFSGEKINGLADGYLLNAPGGRWMVVSDGTDWYIF